MDMRTERAVALIAFAVMSSGALAEGVRPPRLPRLAPEAPLAAIRERYATGDGGFGRVLSRRPNPCETLFRRAERAASSASVANRSREKSDAAAACAVDPQAGAQRIGFAGMSSPRRAVAEQIVGTPLLRRRQQLRGEAVSAVEAF